MESAFGRIVDPFVDKILICGAFIFFSSNHFIDVAVRSGFGVCAGPAADGAGTEPDGGGAVDGGGAGGAGVFDHVDPGAGEAQGVAFRADWAGKIKMFTQSVAAGAVLVDLALIHKVGWVHMTRDVAIWTTVVVTILSATTYVVRAWKIFWRPVRN